MTKVQFEVTDGVAVVTLNRPASLNALDAETHALLAETWVEIKARPEIRALVFTGNGRGFCVGMDLKYVGERGEFRKTDPNAAGLHTMTPLGNDIWLPTIVAVNGVCAGGGLHFVADADIVVASTAATFTDPHVTYGQVAALEPIGLIPRIGLGNSAPPRAPRARGEVRRRRGTAHLPRRRGGRTRRTPAPGARARHGCFQNSPAAMRKTKRVIWESLDVPMAEAMRQGWDAFRSHRNHPDAARRSASVRGAAAGCMERRRSARRMISAGGGSLFVVDGWRPGGGVDLVCTSRCPGCRRGVAESIREQSDLHGRRRDGPRADDPPAGGWSETRASGRKSSRTKITKDRVVDELVPELDATTRNRFIADRRRAPRTLPPNLPPKRLPDGRCGTVSARSERWYRTILRDRDP